MRDLNPSYLALDSGSPRFKSHLLQEALPDTQGQAATVPGLSYSSPAHSGGLSLSRHGSVSPHPHPMPRDCDPREGKAGTVLITAMSPALPIVGLGAESVNVEQSVNLLNH